MTVSFTRVVFNLFLLLSVGSGKPLLLEAGASSNAPPSSVDWRARGAVTSVKDSGSSCTGGSWAFATAAAIEGAYQIATGKLEGLSAQQLLDCQKTENKGCSSGFPQYAFMYLADQSRGLHTDLDYPFTGTNSTCEKKDGVVVEIDGYDNLYSYSEDSEIKEAVARRPVTAVVDGKSSAFINYKSGIFSGPCSDSFVSQSVLIVGYGKENDQEYWIVKNSWGTSWGENGYMRLQMGKCAVNSFVWWPLKSPSRSTQNLVGWWKLNEKSGTTAKDSSPTNATGIVSGSASFDHPDGAGLKFTGAGRVSFGSGPSLCGKTPFTVAAWVKTTSSSKGVILQQRGPSNWTGVWTTDGYNGEYQVYVEGGKPTFFLYAYGDGKQQWRLRATVTVNDGKWHHVAVVREGKEGRIYVDGSLKGSGSGEVKNLVSNFPVYVGCDCRDNVDYFSGVIADVRVYSRALSEGEIKQISSCGTPPCVALSASQ